MSRLFPLLILLVPQVAEALPEAKQKALVREARALIGVPYDLGGRRRTLEEGTDCQGVIFLALQQVFGCGWRSYSVFPTKTVRTRELGFPVPGLSPVQSSTVDISLLQPGDVIFFVGPDQNDVEPTIGRFPETKTDLWVWHTGLYSGSGNAIIGDHFAGEVIETSLLPYLAQHRDFYSGIYVLRMKRKPTPRRCRRPTRIAK